MKLLIALLFCLLTAFPAIASSNTNNISTNPIGLLVGVTNLAYDHKVGEQTTVGGEIAILRIDDGATSQEGEQLGVRGRYHFDKALEDGWLLTGSLGYVQTEVETCLSSITCISAEAKGLYASFIPSYMWMWETFNINLGLGLTYYKLSVESKMGDYSTDDVPLDGISPQLDFSLGWAF